MNLTRLWVCSFILTSVNKSSKFEFLRSMKFVPAFQNFDRQQSYCGNLESCSNHLGFSGLFRPKAGFKIFQSLYWTSLDRKLRFEIRMIFQTLQALRAYVRRLSSGMKTPVWTSKKIQMGKISCTFILEADAGAMSGSSTCGRSKTWMWLLVIFYYSWNFRYRLVMVASV